PNDSISVNTIIESRDAILDEQRFSTLPKTIDSGSNKKEPAVESSRSGNEITELRRSKKARRDTSFDPDFVTYLVKGTRGEVSNKIAYCVNTNT
ncbi:hypothetical protein JJ722_23145, partial [Salmonella enterica subsp. enterica serovar Typhi]|uniref:hypothetical protein n=1 Tax=Salmonella enterica TaxID=28901 RepID=UPI001915DABB